MRLHYALAVTIFALFAFINPDETIADEPRSIIQNDIVLGRFSIERGCDTLVAPVQIGGKTRLFIINTGLKQSIFDRSLPLGKPQGIGFMSTAKGEIEVSVFSAPQATVGNIPFQIDGTVLAYNLGNFREATGLPIEGVLGMDFLGQHVLHFDFNKGEILFLNSSPKDDREKIPMYWQPGELPKVSGILAGSESMRFGINTGLGGFITGYLSDEDIEKMVPIDVLRKVGSVSVESGPGSVLSPLYQGKLLALGNFAVDRPVFGRLPEYNVLGYGFWSRFSSVTFDFPKRTVYLVKGEAYGRSDYWNQSGIYLVQKGQIVMVREVLSDSPGQKAGIQNRDIVLKIGDLSAGEVSFSRLKDRLRKSGQEEFTILRDSKELKIFVDK